LVIAVFLALLSLQAPQTATSVIEGTVTRAYSTQPVEGARVGIWGDHGPDFEARTDANGHYVVGYLPAGVYNIEVQAAGYVSVPNPSTDQKVRLTVGDQRRVRYDVALAATAAIRGQVLDDDRKPVGGVSVEILQLDHDLDGRTTWKHVDSSITDEKGEYRAGELPEGDYYIRASKRPSPNSATSSADLAATYFPSTSDVRSAAVISLRDGDESNAVISLANARTYSIGGQITQPDSKELGPLRLSVIPHDPNIPSEGMAWSGVFLDAPKDGSRNFQIRGLLPGVYDLVVVSLGYTSYRISPNPDPAVSRENFFAGESVAGRVATATVQVRDEDVKDARLSLEPGVSVRGRIRVVGDMGRPPILTKKIGALGWFVATPDSQKGELLSVRLINRHDFISGFLSLEPDITKEESALTFPDVPPGTYRIDLGSTSGIYLADVRDGARSVFDEGLKVSDTPIDLLEVIIGFDGGTIQGTVNDDKGSPLLVVLAPQASRQLNRALFKTMRLDDPSKPFQFVDVAPGIYSLFSFDVPTNDTVSYLSPDFLEQHRKQSLPVTVESNAIIGPVRLPKITRP